MAKEKIKPAVGQIWKWATANTGGYPTFKIVQDFDDSHWVCIYGYSDMDLDDYPCDTQELLRDATMVCPATLPEPKVDATNTTGYRAAEWLRKVAGTLEQKSVSYGDSVGKPLRIFSNAGVTEGIRVRIDDKLSRIARGGRWPGEDVVVDLVGYLALLAVTEDKKE